MPIFFKLVGFIVNKKSFEIKDTYEGQINLLAIQNLFMRWGLTREEVNEIKFIINSEQIKDPYKLYLINPDENYTLFVFVFNQEIRQKLQVIFTSNGTEIESSDELNSEDELMNEPIHQNDDDPIPVLTPEIINRMNHSTIELFCDPDFKTLLSIYKKKPDLFNTLSKYIQKGDIIDTSLMPKIELTEETIIELSKQIIDLNLDIPQDIILKNLIKYSGHLNLTLRSLLYDTV
jgi:hypothetical protein